MGMKLTEEQQNTARAIVPGVPAVNWLSGIMGRSQASSNRQPTPGSRSAEAARTQALRRSRLTNQLQMNAQRAGRAPLSQREIETALAEQGL